jgi:hypothetical protein
MEPDKISAINADKLLVEHEDQPTEIVANVSKWGIVYCYYGGSSA